MIEQMEVKGGMGFGGYERLFTRFDAYCCRRGLGHLVRETRPCDTEVDARGAAESDQINGLTFLYEIGDGLGYAQVKNGHATLYAAGPTPDIARGAMDELERRFPAKDTTKPGYVDLSFWAYGKQGAETRTREVHAPTWDEIRENYPGATQARLAQLMGCVGPENDGKLLLWHGEPGTGKTSAIRALVAAWEEWADFHYITDPEHFFGGHPDYMLEVLLAKSDGWRVLILEDADELLRRDAKQQTGQALSRFLNSVDGLIGQGLRVLTLVTTNEDLAKWHPAVTRHGRTLTRIEFPVLDADEVRGWCAARGVSLNGEARPLCLADLYALIDGRAPLAETQIVGFG